MTTTVLSLFTLAALGEESAKVVGHFDTYVQCQAAKNILLQKHWKEMQKNHTFPMCVDAYTITSDDGEVNIPLEAL